MAEYINESKIRQILRSKFSDTLDKFELLKDISKLIITHPVVGQEFVLRILARKSDFEVYIEVINAMIRQIGLFPYLNEDDLSLKDTIAYEIHRPKGIINDIVFHHAQAEVYYTLLQKENVILSAPTSFGKSLIVDSIIASQRYSNIVIIVPTIALIDETRKRLSEYKSSYKIITHPSQTFASKNVFVLTQERAIEIIQDINVDFFVIDEFYKLSPQGTDEDRCHVLNQVFYMLVKTGAQFYLLGPNIEQVSTKLLDNIKYKFIKTDYKTVVSEQHRITINRSEKSIDKLKELALSLTEPTLIFCQSPSSANRVATSFLECNRFEKNDDNFALAAWLKDNYHPLWILPNCIERGIGIHHGKVPRSIAQKCVKLFNDGKLKFLICTSTLIEGVNTKAKNVIIYDNKIARTKFDYFTFNNICGRSGRMFSHFIGNIYLFHEPPAAELPLVDFPIFTQDEGVPEKLLINIEEEDLTMESKQKLLKYNNQNILSTEVLKRNSYIDLDLQIRLAKFIDNNVKQIYPLMKWTQVPNNDQLKLSCKLIWDGLIKSNRMIYGVSSWKQLHFRINQYREAGNIKKFIESNIQNAKTIEDINNGIELSFDIQKHWINFQFPRYLKSLGDIANDIFVKHNMALCDYAFFSNLVESYFLAPYVVPLDEYGLPIQISQKIGMLIHLSNDIDETLIQLKKFNPNNTRLNSVEKEFVDEFKRYI